VGESSPRRGATRCDVLLRAHCTRSTGGGGHRGREKEAGGPHYRGHGIRHAARYSPDGTQLVFISDRSSGDNLWTLDLATGDMTQVTTGNGVRMDVAGLDPGR